jgi:hypothetical protein
MTNPTSNFGWQMPTSTDLVTDLPADFETFGQAVDTSLADLKGGTSGQVLSKASNTDMDFTWTTATSGAPFVAGKNKIINGDMGVWQRGTSTTLTNNTFGFGPDRFRAYVTFSAGTSTFAQQTFTAGTAPVAGYEGTYFARITCGSTSTYTEVSQRIEDVRTLAGQTATVSFWAKSSAALVFTPYLIQSFGTGGSSDVLTAASNITLTTSWVRYTATISVPSVSGKTIGANNTLVWALTHVSGTLNSATIDLWGVQVEAGSSATNFSTASQTIQGELALCQRYYEFIGGKVSGYPIIGAYATAGISGYFPIAFKVSKRVSPTVTKVGTWAVGNTGQPSPNYIGVDGFSSLQTATATGAFFTYPDSTDDGFTVDAEL